MEILSQDLWAVEQLERLRKYCFVSWKRRGLSETSLGDEEDQFQEVIVELMKEKRFILEDAMNDPNCASREILIRVIQRVNQRNVRARKECNEAFIFDLENTKAQLNKAPEEDELSMIKTLIPKVIKSQKQQAILLLTLAGETVTQIAENLKMETERVSDEKYKATVRIRNHLMSSPV